jgi:hypothetical protein
LWRGYAAFFATVYLKLLASCPAAILALLFFPAISQLVDLGYKVNLLSRKVTKKKKLHKGFSL